MSKKLKRNELDVIITDLLPVEISEIFTYTNFYHFLNENKSILRNIESKFLNAKYTNERVFSSHRISATPIKYEVYKNNKSTRTLSILSPISALQIYVFVKLFSESILNKLKQNNCFSVRYHTSKKSLYYLRKKDGFIEYADEDLNIEELEGIESSGMFFDIQEYGRIKELYRSDLWFKLNTQYSYFAKLDYQACFDSIYTHTLKWIISDNVIDSRNFSETNNVLSVADRLLQQINSSISNGILVGPEFSRMIAEILLQQIDKEVYNTLLNEGYENDKHYRVIRYVDDLFIFSDDNKLITKVIESYSIKAKKFQLRINESKTERGTLPHIWSIWIHDIKQYIREIESKHFYDTRIHKDKNYRLRTKNLKNLIHISSIKEEFQRIIALYPEFSDKIVRYVFGFYSNNLNKRNSTKLFKDNAKKEDIEALIDFLFFHFSYAPTYRNTQLLITFINRVDKIIGSEITGEVLQEIVSKYSYIFSRSTVHDFANLVLVLSKYGVQLSSKTEDFLWSRIKQTSDPIQHVNYLLYSKYNNNYYHEVISEIEVLIKKKLNVITDEKHVFLYPETWWIIIFSDFDEFSQDVKDIFKEKINLIKSLNNDGYGLIRNLLYDYLSNEKYMNKFVKWQKESNDYLESITFKTFEKTLFNGKFDFEYDWEY